MSARGIASMEPTWQPTCHVVVRENATATDIVQNLKQQGWRVVRHPTGYHLIEALADAILGERPWNQVRMIVVDDASSGCRGASIVRGLREAGAQVPVVIVASGRDPEVHQVEDPSSGVHVLDPLAAPAGVARIARHIYAGPTIERAGTPAGRAARA